MDGVVHILPNGESKTLSGYADVVFIPRVFFELDKTQRLDLVRDVYIKDSLKHSTRANRGTGTRKWVSSHAKLPGNWENFLRNFDYKDHLFQFLGHECVSEDTGHRTIVSTLLDSVVSSTDGQIKDGL